MLAYYIHVPSQMSRYCGHVCNDSVGVGHRASARRGEMRRAVRSDSNLSPDMRNTVA